VHRVQEGIAAGNARAEIIFAATYIIYLSPKVTRLNKKTDGLMFNP
jgi:hypothetical protein